MLPITGCRIQPPPVEEPDDETPLIDLNDPYLILVNAQNPLPEGFKPELKTVQGNLQLEVTAADALQEMIAAAKEVGLSLLVVSAYRSPERQAVLYENKVQEWIGYGYSRAAAEAKAATIVALPGTSEHHTGLAADIVTPDYQRLNAGFAETAAAKWMANYAHRYGFILRYPEDKEEVTGIIFEPWHFRYVGKEHAKAIQESGLSLEEYLDQGR
ncbi:MAG: M15 family metallopeptidase [Bacillota bacterium]